MANDTKEIILDIKVQNKTAIDEIVRLQKELDQLKIEQLKETAAEKNGIKTHEEASRSLAEIKAKTQALSQSKREYEKIVKQNIQTELEQDGSLKQMRAQLANLIDTYDRLSSHDRLEIGGVGEQTLLEIRRLQEELKNAEEASGRFQRSVGSYEDAIKRAMSGTVPMRTAMKELRNELYSMTFQNQELGRSLNEEEQKLLQLAQTNGTTSQAYKDQAQIVEELSKKYKSQGAAITDLSQKMGEIDDAVKDANESFANYGKDNANLKAATDGVALLLDGYTGLQAGMVALGVESDALIDIFAKIQVLQQGLNAVNQIANTLEKQSVFMQQARVLWTKITTQSIASLIAAKKVQNAETVKTTVAEGAEVAATTAVSAANTAATATTWSFVGALKAAGVAIKSIPVIGWIITAVAALGTLIGLVVKANKESEKGNELQRQAASEAKKYNDIKEKAFESTAKDVKEMQQAVDRLKQLTSGSAQWNHEIEGIAKELGIDVEWLKKNESKVEDLANAWIAVKKAMAMADAFNQASVDEEIKKNKLLLEIENMKLLPKKDQEEAAKKLKDEYNLTTDQVEKLTKASEKYAKSRAKGWNQKTAQHEKEMYDAVSASIDRMDSNIKSFADSADKATQSVQQQVQTLEEAEKAAKKYNSANKGNRTDKTTDYRNDAAEAQRQLEDTVLSIMRESNEKELAELSKGYDDKISTLKAKQAKLLDTIKTANATEIDELKKHYNYLTKEQEVLEARKQVEISKLREKQHHEDVQEEYRRRKELIEAQLKGMNAESLTGKQLSQTVIEIDFHIEQDKLQQQLDEATTEMNEWKTQMTADDETLIPLANAMSISVESYRDYAARMYAAAQEEQVKVQNKMLANQNAYNYAIDKLNDEHTRKMQEISRNTEDNKFYANILREMAAAELLSESQKEIELSKIEEKSAQHKLDVERNKLSELKALSQKEIEMRYGTTEAYNEAVSQQEVAVVEAENAKQQAIKKTNQLVDQQNKKFQDAVNSLGQAMDKMAGSLSDLFNVMAENNDRYSEWATAMAMMQILISSAVSIAQAIQGATTAAAAGGPAAPVLIAAYVAEMVGIVAAGIANAVSTLKQAKESKQGKPRFATGGYVSEGASGVDKVDAKLTKGEYVINKKRVDELGVDLLDRLNFGKIVPRPNTTGHYASGGIVTQHVQVQQSSNEVNMDTMREMFADVIANIQPVVSVKEITSKQNRIKVKEDVARM